VLVSRVEEDTPAAKAGLRAGDVIIAVDGKGISERGDIAEALSDHEPGDRVAVKIVRDGSDKTVDVEIAERSRPRHRSMFLPEEHDHEMEMEEEEEASPEVEESVLESLRQAHDEIERAAHIDFSKQMSAAEAAFRQAGMLDRRSQEEIQRQIERSMREAQDEMQRASSIDFSKPMREAQAALRQAGMFDRRNQEEIQRQIERSMKAAQDALRQAAERMSEESSF
jgi:membrane-associated protease RseP (regulator of RpoE activity)